MKIKILLNNLKYRYDVYQIFNIYFLLEEILFVTDEIQGDYVINIEMDYILMRHGDYSEKIIYKDYIGYNNFIKKSIFEFLKKETGEIHPWGTLIGIRPSKIALQLLQDGKSQEEIIDYFKRVYCAASHKAELCIKIAEYEASFVNKDKNKVSIYIGMPFCPTRCSYCSFASNPISGSRSLVKPYLEALSLEIKELSKYIDAKDLFIETVYFGGGTPTSVSDEEFYNIMSLIYKSLIKDRNIIEFTVECGRPDSISINKLKTMKDFSVDRISINPQSMNDKTLKRIGRLHSSDLVKDVYNEARKLGFNNINMDVIVGLPGEGIEELTFTCKELESLSPDSLTVHGLSIKRASKLHESIVLNKEYHIPKQQELSLMYKETELLANKLNMIPYYMYRQKNMIGNMENVGYTLKGKECIYNIEMIEERQTIIALGADGISKVVFLEENRIERFANTKDVKQYIERIDELIEGKIKLLNSLYS